MPSGIKPAPEVDALMVSLYQSGLSEAKVAKQVGLTPAGVHGALKRLAVPKRAARCSDNTPLTDEIKDRIASVYLAGHHTYETARIVGVSQRSVCKTLELRKVPFRSLESVNRNPGVNHDFFDCIDTDAKAWVLGFISADGCVVQDRNAIFVMVAEKDAEIIDKIRALVCPGVKIRTVRMYSAYAKRIVTNVLVRWSSAQQAMALRTLGVVPRKSYCLEPWNGPVHLLPAYYRGLIDGDGTWSVSRKTGNIQYVGLFGTKAICAGFGLFVASVSPGPSLTPHIYPPNPAWRVTTSSKPRLKAIATAFYKDATIWLARKRAIAERLL